MKIGSSFQPGKMAISFLALSVAYRFELHKKYGTPIIAGKKRGQSIREFGLCRTVVAVICPSCETVDPGDSCRLMKGFLLTAIVLHLYVSLFAVFDLMNAGFVSKVLVILNGPFMQLLMQLPSFKSTAVKLIIHGYENRISIISHVYIVSAIGCIIYGIYWFSLFFRRDVLGPFYTAKSKEAQAFKQRNSGSFIKSLWGGFVGSPFGGWILILGVTIICSLFIVYALRIPLYFPGEPHARHGKYIWMYSYVYKDNIGLFMPIYYMAMPFMMICGGVPFVFEPLYRLYLYLSRIIKN